MERDGINEPKIGLVDMPPPSSAIVGGVVVREEASGVGTTGGDERKIDERSEGADDGGVRGMPGDDSRGQDGEGHDVDDDVRHHS